VANVLDSPDLCRAVVDLKVKDNSYNEIVDFCARVLHVTINKDEIAKILMDAGKRAKHLNGIYDTLVKPAVRYIVVDEIFQGRHNCYLGSADPTSHYLFLLRGIRNRSEETLLNPRARGFQGAPERAPGRGPEQSRHHNARRGESPKIAANPRKGREEVPQEEAGQPPSRTLGRAI